MLTEVRVLITKEVHVLKAIDLWHQKVPLFLNDWLNKDESSQLQSFLDSLLFTIYDDTTIKRIEQYVMYIFSQRLNQLFIGEYTIDVLDLEGNTSKLNILIYPI